jgi:hypothetical protein
MAKGQAFDQCPTDELVRLYETSASEHGRANRQNDFRAGKPAAHKIVAIYKVIKSRGLDHQRLLLPLLLSNDNGVRSWAACHALEFAPNQGESTLLDLAKLDGLEGFNAKMTLKAWREARPRFSQGGPIDHES